ncbi:MAG: hypothetical protein D6797_08750 [Bdellovibrio sp.]|nr:MAG: hypothetical protein D6797_08750 [Bdellovibrio sp.]
MSHFKTLLQTRLCDLPIPPLENHHWIQEHISKLYKELDRKGISWRPHIWVSDEWFCPDGVPGFALPFYLLDERLKRLERLKGFEVEGHSSRSFMRLLRHETGHAIDNAYKLRRCSLRRELFGPSEKPYPKSYEPVLYSRKYVNYLGDGYAQSHPDEDFAETFAVWLDPQSQWRRKYRSWPVYKKLIYMDKLLKSLKEPALKNTKKVEPLSQKKITLAQYYQKKRYYYRQRFLIQKQFRQSCLRQKNTASSIMTVQKILRDKVSEQIGVPKYKIAPIIKEMMEVIRQDELGPPQINRGFLHLVTLQVREHLNCGRHRILL